MKRPPLFLVLLTLALALLPSCTPPGGGADAKPVIYLYPEAETDVTVTLDYDGELTCTYPAYADGWTVSARPDGTLTDKDGNAIDVTKPFEAAGDLTVTVALKDDGSIKDSFTMTVTDKGTVDPDPDPTPKPNPDPQKPSGDNKPQIKPEGGKPGDVVAETGASVSGAALAAMICAAGAPAQHACLSRRDSCA